MFELRIRDNAEGIAVTSHAPGGAVTYAATGSSGDPDIDGLLSGYSWDRVNLTYSFPTSSSQYEYQGPPNFLAASPQYQAAFQTIFQSVAAFSGLTFTLASSPGGGDLRMAFGDTGYAGYAYYPGPAEGGDSWYNSGNAGNPTPLGSQDYFLLLHEIGHSLGLKHGHEAPAMSPEHNMHEFSIMTYRSHAGSPADPPLNGTEEHGGSPQTFMMYDIAALQHLYGANFSHNSGNTVYQWDPDSGQMFINGQGQGVPWYNRIFLTLWDGGGNDTYDLSNYANDVSIDLAPGGWTTTSASQLVNLYYTGDPDPPVYARGNVANALLHHGDTRSLIENAIGGSGNDVLAGNQASNKLLGNAGHDLLDGRGGADRMFGGSGNDVYLADDYNDRAVELAVQGIDEVRSSANFRLGENVENLTLTGNAALWGYGNGLDNVLSGNGAVNKLYALGGNDRLDGGAGADRLFGGAGDDIYYVDDYSDKVFETAGEGSDSVFASTNYRLGDHVEKLTLTGIASLWAYGSTSGNVLIGNGSANKLYGLGGDDVLRGMGGNDMLEGGAGRDVLYGGEGADTFVFRDGDFAAATRSGCDQIKDWDPADLLRLRDVDANTNITGDQNFTFLGTSAFTGTAGQLRYEQVSGNTYVYGDTDGDGAADFMVRLDGLHVLTNADLLI